VASAACDPLAAPEWFTEREGASGRTLAYGLCYYASHGAGATDVSFRLVDPDGGMRSSNHVLYETGDSVVVGTSPTGAAFEPEEGWCRGT
jgi:hypothetical protein